MNDRLNQKKLLDRIREELPMERDEAETLIADFFDIVAGEIRDEERIAIHGFGSFRKSFIEESSRRNPRTGEVVVVPSHFRIKFSPAAALSERVNVEFAGLEPIILEDKEPEGLLARAIRYRESLEPEPVEESAGDPPLQHSQDFPPEPLEGLPPEALSEVYQDTKPPEPPPVTRGKRRILTAVGVMAILLGLLGFLLLRSPAGLTGEQGETAVSDRTEESGEAAGDAGGTTQEGPVLYEVTRGDTFSIIARDRWGNLDLWPYLYDLNRTDYPDPDRIYPGDRIMIPPRPEEAGQMDEIEKSIIMTYHRYRLLVETQSTNPRNGNRQLSIRNILMGGELLYPDFLERNRRCLRTEDIPLFLESAE